VSARVRASQIATSLNAAINVARQLERRDAEPLEGPGEKHGIPGPFSRLVSNQRPLACEAAEQRDGAVSIPPSPRSGRGSGCEPPSQSARVGLLWAVGRAPDRFLSKKAAARSGPLGRGYRDYQSVPSIDRSRGSRDTTSVAGTQWAVTIAATSTPNSPRISRSSWTRGSTRRADRVAPSEARDHEAGAASTVCKCRRQPGCLHLACGQRRGVADLIDEQERTDLPRAAFGVLGDG
jgi:hypothetical protein